jgi:ketosteroid isomerase-like protein
MSYILAQLGQLQHPSVITSNGQAQLESCKLCQNHKLAAFYVTVKLLLQHIAKNVEGKPCMQDEFEATNACVYEMEKRLEERFVEVKTDVSLATAECRQQTVSEAVRTGKLQLDNLQDRLTTRIQGVPLTNICNQLYRLQTSCAAACPMCGSRLRVCLLLRKLERKLQRFGPKMAV